MISRLKWLSLSIELFLAIPIFGGVLAEMMPYLLSWIAIWHAAVLVISRDEDEPTLGSFLGMVAAFTNFFPVIRVFAHGIAALVLALELKKGPGTE
ncbi:hypothetical protein WAK64_16440 [Bacillus spongiae]|uniref:DUF2568 domain-containing protein n=1 Tax=Bacillus spongiae TaxID=2683610 RepID=A0ABU8HHM2_9BACI